MKRVSYMVAGLLWGMAFGLWITVAQAQTLTTSDWPLDLTPRTGVQDLAFRQDCIETIKSFSLQDGRIVIEKHSKCHPNMTPAIGCWPGPCDFTQYRQWREIYGVKEGKLELLKTEEAKHFPAQAERWEYPSNSNASATEFKEYKLTEGVGLTLSLDNQKQLVTVMAKKGKKQKKERASCEMPGQLHPSQALFDAIQEIVRKCEKEKVREK